jgi:hypothetical protein
MAAIGCYWGGTIGFGGWGNKRKKGGRKVPMLPIFASGTVQNYCFTNPLIVGQIPCFILGDGFAGCYL